LIVNCFFKAKNYEIKNYKIIKSKNYIKNIKYKPKTKIKYKLKTEKYGEYYG